MKNTSLYGLPEKIIFCKLCVISNQRPSSTVEFKSSEKQNKSGISIDDEGICDACSYNKKKLPILLMLSQRTGLKNKYTLCAKV